MIKAISKIFLTLFFLAFLAILGTNNAHALITGTADVIDDPGGQTKSISYCAIGTRAEIESISQVRVTCRRSALWLGLDYASTVDCHDDNSFGFTNLPVSQTKNFTPEVFQEGDQFFTCFTIQSFSIDAGIVEVNILDNAGNVLDSKRANVAVNGHTDLFPYLQRTLETRFPPETIPPPLSVCDTPNGSGIDTAIGCIPFESPTALFGFALSWGVGIGGGVAFLQLVYAGFLVMTSAGNPDRLKNGKELITSAVSGLVLLIFSIIILRVIGVDILHIPGFFE